MPDPREYTVGWICPTANELRAAVICLDKKHPRLRARTAPNDTNAYTLGEINEHNVVIANFPIGTQGLVSAATVAGNLVRSFPNVSVVLMVGIGGGAPLLPDRDIRLGDVVVSCPGGGKPGVVQYDFGKLIQGRPFETTMALNRPPPALLTGAMQLEVKIKGKRDQLEQCIEAILGKRDEETREKFARPAVESDRLFRSEVMHEDGESCAEVCTSDKSNIVTRLPRTQRPNTPRVFHGLIASANQLMKDAPVRDMYAREQKILCFEMEAAGLMNDFPCLVVRGISDYSDTHKNDEWQPYAALAAAVYARELLAMILPNQIEGEKSMTEFLAVIGSKVDEISNSVQEIQLIQHTQCEQKILDWLSSPEYATYHDDVTNRRQSNTGQWFFDSDEYKDWRSHRNRTLFCPGMPGAGKTYMAAAVIDALLAESRSRKIQGVAYLYLNYRQQASPQDLLSSLLRQMADKQTTLPKSVQDLHSRHETDHTRPSVQELSEVLEMVCDQNHEFYFVIDAIDEYDSIDRYRFLDMIFKLQQKTSINVLFTSRFIAEITEAFQHAIRFEIRASDKDVGAYLTSRLDDLRIVRNKKDLREEIKETIVERVQGMFLLAQLHMDSLTYISFSAFEDGPCKTTESFRDRAQCYSLYEYAALNWGHHARENASPCDEVVEFLKSPGPHIQASVEAMDLDLLGYFPRPQSRTTGLHLAAHFGLKQVVAILLQDSSVDSVNGEGETPLQLAAKQGHIATMRLLVDHGAMIDACDGHGRTALVRTAEYDGQIEPEQVVQLLLERGANVGAADGLGCTPLHYAARRQRLGTAKLLLEKRANPNVTDERGHTPLYEAFKTAIETGSEQTVQLLLHYRAGISDEDGPRLLRNASGKAQDQVVLRLLELGVKADAVDDEGKTPLHYLLSKFWAPSDIDLNDVEGRLRRIVAGLLARSPLMINIQDQYGRTPLHIEDWFYRRHHGIYVMRARILVESGAKLDVKDKHELILLQIMAATVKTEAELDCILKTAATRGNGSFTNNALVAALRSALINGNAGNAVSLFRRISMSELDFGEARLMLRFCFELRLEDEFGSEISVLTRSHPGIMSITDEFGWQLEDLQYHSSTTAASPAAAGSRIDSFATRLLIPTRLVLPHGWPRFQGLRLNKLSFSCSPRGISPRFTKRFTVRSDNPFPPRHQCHPYFEAFVRSSTSANVNYFSIAIGLIGNFVIPSDAMPGWPSAHPSIGLHSDYSKVDVSTGLGSSEKLAEPCHGAFTIGIGIDWSKEEFFFTRNGQVIGTLKSSLIHYRLFPVVTITNLPLESFASPSSSRKVLKVEVNFGGNPGRPFAYSPQEAIPSRMQGVED